MKNIIIPFLLTFIYYSPTIAQNTISETECMIRELSEKEITAIISHDYTTLDDIWAENFMVNNPYNMVINGRSVVFDRMKEGVINYNVFEREIEGMMILDKTAIEMGLETVYPKEGAPMAGQKVLRRYTNFWMFENGNWIIQARHANVICNSN